MTALVAAVYERRTFLEPIEFRSEGSGKIVASGYAAVFNKLSQNLGGYVEQFAPGSFTKTLQEQDVRALYNHDPNALLGRMSSGTLRAEEDGTGLAYEIDLPDTTVGRDVATMLERGDLSGSSIGFRVVEQERGETEQGFPLVTVRSVSLRDLGPVTFPAYTDTEASLQSMARSLNTTLDEIRTLLHPPTDGPVTTESLPETGEDADGRETPTVKRYLRSFGAY